MGTQSQKWLWTLDVEECDLELPEYLDSIYNPDKIEYLLAGEEVGEENGRRHFQGLVVVRNRMRMRTVKLLFDRDTVHIGDADGRPIRNLSAAIAYCKKQGRWLEHGTPPQESDAGAPVTKRWERARDLAKEGQVMAIFDENPEFIRYQDHLLKYAARFRNPAERPTLDNFWLWGPAGTGKSRIPRDLEGEKLAPVPLEFGRFTWQDYDPSVHEAILFEDVRAEDIRAHLRAFKIWMDHYPFAAELKGGTLGKIRPLRIYITSAVHPQQVVPHDHWAEFNRRITILTGAEARVKFGLPEFKPPS